MKRARAVGEIAKKKSIWIVMLVLALAMFAHIGKSTMPAKTDAEQQLQSGIEFVEKYAKEREERGEPAVTEQDKAYIDKMLKRSTAPSPFAGAASAASIFNPSSGNANGK